MKDRIRTSFNSSVKSYDKVASLQRVCADTLVEMIGVSAENFLPNSILDVGTGTGYLAKKLRSFYPDAKITLNDVAPKMLEAALSNISSKGLDTILGDMDDEENFGEYDLISSNLAFQWSSDVLEVIKNFSGKSKYLAFACLLKGSFREWQESCAQISSSEPVYDYPTKGELEISLSELDICDSKILEFNLEFDGAKEVIRYFQDLGAIRNAKHFSVGEVRKLMELHTKQVLNYKVFFCVLKGKG